MRLKILYLLPAAALLTSCYCDSLTTNDVCVVAVTKDAVKPGTTADFVANVGDRIFFDFDKAAVHTEGLATIKRQGEWLKKYPAVIATIEAHCDERGTVKYNLVLGERRAKIARELLIKQGVDGSRLRIINFGKSQPVAPGHTEDADKQNRIAITVID